MRTVRSAHLARIALLLLAAIGASNAGIQGSGRAYLLSYGRITGLELGQIKVQGIGYATSQAQIRIEDVLASQSALKLGQVVLVQGVLNPDGVSARATQVSFNADVQGPVAQINATNRTFTVLGQAVRVTDATLFGAGIQPAGIDGLQSGDSLQVSGFANASGELIASRIDPAVDTSSLRVRGTVQNLDSAAQTFSINGLPIDYSAATSTGPFAAGAVARVLGYTTSPEGVLVASSINAAASGLGGPPEARASIEGIITSFDSNASFSVNGQKVITDSSTRFNLRGGALGLNTAVEVTGLFAADGVLVATQVTAATQIAAAAQATAATSAR